jgi:hypothetical protein
LFQGLGGRQVVASFDGGRISSEGGALLLRAVDGRLGLIERLATCFDDYRSPEWVDHPVEDLLRQRVFALALGYEDLNDHEALRDDALLATCVGKSDPTGESRRRERDPRERCHPFRRQTPRPVSVLGGMGRPLRYVPPGELVEVTCTLRSLSFTR